MKTVENAFNHNKKHVETKDKKLLKYVLKRSLKYIFLIFGRECLTEE